MKNNPSNKSPSHSFNEELWLGRLMGGTILTTLLGGVGALIFYGKGAEDDDWRFAYVFGCGFAFPIALGFAIVAANRKRSAILLAAGQFALATSVGLLVGLCCDAMWQVIAASLAQFLGGVLTLELMARLRRRSGNLERS